MFWMKFVRNVNGDLMFKNIINKAKAKGEEKRELRAIEKASYEEEKKKVKAATKQKKIAEAKGRLIIVETSSKPQYARTREFYYSMNYQTIGRIPDFYAPSDDKLILQKTIPSQINI